MTIRHLILDYDGVFTLDDYTAVSEALSASSGIPTAEIEGKIGDIERRYVLTMDPRHEFLKEVARGFSFKGSIEYLEELLNRRGDSGLFKELPKFKKAGLALSILSNQIAYRLPHVREEIKNGARDIGGITGFERVYFSPEIGLQKPFVGVSEADAKSGMDTTGVDIFPYVVKDMKKLGYSADELLFFDDSKKNVASAQRAGIGAHVVKFDKISPSNTIYRQIRDIFSREYKIKLD